MASPLQTIAPGSVNANNQASTDFSTSLYSFLDKLSPSHFSRLYQAPASCLSIFRLLPTTARHVVMNTLWDEQEVKIGDVALWVKERRGDGGAANERRYVDFVLLSPPSAFWVSAMFLHLDAIIIIIQIKIPPSS